jgi:hypothetical protein
MPRFDRIANWGAIQKETGPVTAQVLRRILGSAGGRGGVLESAIMNVFRTTNIYGGGSIPGIYPLRVIGKPPPQFVIGYNDSLLWNHEIHSDGSYKYTQGTARTIYFEISKTGHVAINNPATDDAWFNIKNPGADEDIISALNPVIWIDANDPIGDGTAPSGITDATDIESLSSGHWTDKGSGGSRHVTTSNGAGTKPVWYKTAGSNPKAPSLPNGKPYVSTIPGGVGSDNFTTWSSTNFTIYAVYWHHPLLFTILGSDATGAGQPGNIRAQSTDNDSAERGEIAYENATTKRWTFLHTTLDTTARWALGKWVSDGTHEIDETNIPEFDQSGSPGGTMVLEEWFQRTINSGSIQRTSAWIAEVLVFDSVLSAEDQTTVEEYLKTKWGVAGGGSGAGSNPLIHLLDSADVIKVEFDERGRLHIGGENPTSMLVVSNDNATPGTLDTTGGISDDLTARFMVHQHRKPSRRVREHGGRDPSPGSRVDVLAQESYLR